MRQRSVLVVVAALALGAFGAPAQAQSEAPASSATSEQACSHPSNGKPCTVAMVVPGVANDFRVQTVKTAESAAAKEPFASLWDFSVTVTDNTAEAQNAALDNLLAQGIDALLLVAVSDTSANEQVARACEQGVTVVTFDTIARADACEIRLELDTNAWGTATGNYFAEATGCTGTFLFDQGLQGVSSAAENYDAEVAATQAKCGDQVKTVGFFSEYNPATSETLVSSLLATNPDVTAVMNTSCATTAKVFDDAGAELPVLGCQGYNADVQTLLREGVNGIATAATGAVGYGAMELAFKALGGEDVPADSDWPSAFIVTDPSIDVGTDVYPTVKAEEGVNAFPDLPGGIFVIYQWPDSIVDITVEDALGGE